MSDDSHSEKVESADISKKLHDACKQLGSLYTAAHKPISTGTGDGSALEEPPHDGIKNDFKWIFRDMRQWAIHDMASLMKTLKDMYLREEVNDRHYLMEGLIVVGSSRS